MDTPMAGGDNLEPHLRKPCAAMICKFPAKIFAGFELLLTQFEPPVRYWRDVLYKHISLRDWIFNHHSSNL